MDYRIISIGTLSRHELWNEPGETRTPHATTTLIRSGDRTILVDPGLPPQVITARIGERSGLKPEDITHVFLTNFRPAHRWGLPAFEAAEWLISGVEREFIEPSLIAHIKNDTDSKTQEILEQEIALLQRCQPAPDRLADQVDLFPLPGFTPGTCGLLLSLMNSTAVIASDAVATAEHLEQGRVLRGAADVDAARESLTETLEIADVIVPGHDNLLLNPTRRPM